MTFCSAVPLGALPSCKACGWGHCSQKGTTGYTGNHREVRVNPQGKCLIVVWRRRIFGFQACSPKSRKQNPLCAVRLDIRFLSSMFSTNKTSRSSALMPHRSGWPSKSACCIFQKLLKQHADLSKFQGLPRQILPILPFPKAPDRNSIALMPSLSRDKPRSDMSTSRCTRIHWS